MSNKDQKEQDNWSGYWYGLPDTTVKQPETCTHELKFYQGFSDQFYYCTKCDAKVDASDKV